MGKINKTIVFSVLLATALFLGLFQNCSEVEFSSDYIDEKVSTINLPEGPPQVPPTNNCIDNPTDCDPEVPYVSSAGVVTILLALGDLANNELVVKEESSRLIAEDMVKWASPKKDPKILLVFDHNNANEDPEDFVFIEKELLAKYEVTAIDEPNSGLTSAMLEGYDLVWFNNPGHPMGSEATRDVLIAFTGGVILSGDDLTRGNGFSMEELTGMVYIDNGVSNVCEGQTYKFDNNSGNQYSVTLDSAIFPGVANDMLTFKYGNDIDMSKVSGATEVADKVEILAQAMANFGDCFNLRPTVVRYGK